MSLKPIDVLSEIRKDKKKFIIAVLAVTGIFLVGVSALLPSGKKQAEAAQTAAPKTSFDEAAYTKALEK